MRPTVSEIDVWDYIKDEYGVTSRSHLFTEEWARISAQFNAANRNAKLLEDLIHEVSEHQVKRKSLKNDKN